MDLIKKSIFRSGIRVNWNMTLQELITEVKSWKSRPDGLQLMLRGEKGYGKSTMLEHLERSRPDLIVVEGDIVTVAAMCVHATGLRNAARPLGDIAKDPMLDLWARYKTKDAAKEHTVNALFRESLPKIDVCSGFHGFKAKTVGVIVPDYKSYVQHLKARIKAMTDGPSDPFKEHVKRTHIVETFDQMRANVLDFVSKADAKDRKVAFIPNDFSPRAGVFIDHVVALLEGRSTDDR